MFLVLIKGKPGSQDEIRLKAHERIVNICNLIMPHAKFYLIIFLLFFIFFILRICHDIIKQQMIHTSQFLHSVLRVFHGTDVNGVTFNSLPVLLSTRPPEGLTMF